MDVVGAKRLRRLQHRTEHAVGPWQRPHGRNQLLAHPRDEEAAKAALAIWDAEGGKARVCELSRGMHELLQDLLYRPLRSHRQHRTGDGLQRGAERAFRVAYFVQEIDGFLFTVPLLNLSENVLFQ